MQFGKWIAGAVAGGVVAVVGVVVVAVEYSDSFIGKPGIASPAGAYADVFVPGGIVFLAGVVVGLFSVRKMLDRMSTAKRQGQVSPETGDSSRV